MTSLRLSIGALCALALLLPVAGAPAGAATSDRPTTGRFTGEHSFNGPITLRFAREDGIGLHLARWSVKGTLRCPDGENVPIDEGGPVTARTAARVKPDRTFRLHGVTVQLRGRFVSSRRVRGDITIRTSACSSDGGFTAKRRG
jgi:hypothetical protein